MLTAALEQRLSRAGMRQTACMENLDLRTPRGLDRSTMQALAGGQWIREHRNVLVSGAAGIGKSWIACALGNQAAREGISVLYKRLSRRLDDRGHPNPAGPLARADWRSHVCGRDPGSPGAQRLPPQPRG